MRIIKEGQWIPVITYNKIFGVKNAKSDILQNMRYSFECDSEGEIDETKLVSEGLRNLKLIIKKEMFDSKTGDLIEFLGIYKNQSEQKDPAIGLCEYCECKVTLEDPMTNECSCGRLYNGAGQELLPRDQWEKDY